MTVWTWLKMVNFYLLPDLPTPNSIPATTLRDFYSTSILVLSTRSSWITLCMYQVFGAVGIFRWHYGTSTGMLNVLYMYILGARTLRTTLHTKYTYRYHCDMYSSVGDTHTVCTVFCPWVFYLHTSCNSSCTRHNMTVELPLNQPLKTQKRPCGTDFTFMYSLFFHASKKT